MRALAVVCSVYLCSCATTLSARASGVRESDGSDVTACAYVGDFFGSSMLSGPAGRSAGYRNAKNEVLEQAADAGATHLVWAGTHDGGGNIEMKGKAYRCPK